MGSVKSPSAPNEFEIIFNNLIHLLKIFLKSITLLYYIYSE